MIGRATVALLACLGCALALPAGTPAQEAPQVTYCTFNPCEPFPTLGWEGAFRSQRVELPSQRSGARLAGTLVLPPKRATHRGEHPLVVIIPGSGGTAREEGYHWAARYLASHGYVALGVDPQGVGRSAAFGDPACDPAAVTEDLGYPYPCEGVPLQQRPNFDDAALSGIAWALSSSNPARRLIKRRRIGVAGHSLGAAAAVSAQEADARVDAIVAWDGLDADRWSMDQNAPTHHLVNGHVPLDGKLEQPNVPRAPALALHAESDTTSPYDRDPQKRNRGWAHWRESGVPSVALVFAGTTHIDFGQGDETSEAASERLQTFARYTRAWFDRYLLGRRGADRSLIAPATIDLLSPTWASAAFLPHRRVDCSDLRAGCD